MSNTIANRANNEIGNSNNIGKTIIPNLAGEKDRDVERGEPVRGGNPNPTPVSTSASPSASATEAHPGAPHGVVPSRRKAVARLLRRLVLGMLLVAVLAAVSALVWIYMGPIFLLQLVLVAIVAYFASGGRLRWFYVVVKTAPRDVRALSRYARVLWAIRNYQKKNRSIADLFQLNVQRHPNKVCLIFQDQEWTFQQVDDFSNKVANVFKSHGYRKGDVVGLFLENRPEFVAIWLGLSKLGVIIPLINTNLVKSSLLHGINISKCQAVIYGTDLAEAIKDIASTLDAKIALYRFSDKPGEPSNGLKEKDLTALLADAPASLPVVQEKGEYMDKLLYVFTSGTTGLPKAAVITNSRFMFIASGIHYLGAFKESDRYYTPLPLYHTAGGIMTIGQTLIHGSTTVIRKKFSASSYFNDCTKYKCTVGQYIGEMCRYILASPPKSDDKNHTVRLMFGNGLRPQIWTEFVNRFNIPKIVEFYGATEGNANIVNVDSTVGAIGFISRIIPSVYPISIIKVNDQGEPIRNAQGLCQVCEPNEPGVFIGKIIPNNPSRAFLGYVDQKASKSKVVHDVFKKGDSAFISGDILMADELGYLYFKDRTGDTFRWKGENVSTSEVEGILSNLVNYRDCIVYGVEIRGAEGRAGMAAIYDPDGTLDMDKLSSDVREHLPSYARPLFVRILRTIEVTGTFKLKKKELQEEGFDVRKLEDKIYYMDPKSGYQLLTSELFDNIQEGKLRL